MASIVRSTSLRKKRDPDKFIIWGLCKVEKPHKHKIADIYLLEGEHLYTLVHELFHLVHRLKPLTRRDHEEQRAILIEQLLKKCLPLLDPPSTIPPPSH